MPYRVKQGESVIILKMSGERIPTSMTRTIDFTKAQLKAAPHLDLGLPISNIAGYPWAFDIQGLWENRTDLQVLFAKEVNVVPMGTSKDVGSVTVAGSKGKTYTLILAPGDGTATSCNCMGYRFSRMCKHITEYNKIVRP